MLCPGSLFIWNSKHNKALQLIANQFVDGFRRVGSSPTCSASNAWKVLHNGGGEVKAMKVIIEAEPKEIAGLVLELQARQEGHKQSIELLVEEDLVKVNSDGILEKISLQ